jgi:cytochrome P450
LFGESLGCLSGNIPPHAEGFLEAFHEGFRGAGMRMAVGPFAFLLPEKKWLEACAKAHRFADHYVAKALKYREEFLAGKIGEADSKSGIMLYNMAEQTGDPIYIRNQLLQTLMAAQETTANLLGNVIFLLSRDEAVFRKLRAEVLSFGNKLTAKDLTAMKDLRNVINEGTHLFHNYVTNH